MACVLSWYYFPIESTNISRCSFASMQIEQTDCLHKYGAAVLQSIYSMLTQQQFIFICNDLHRSICDLATDGK